MLLVKPVLQNHLASSARSCLRMLGMQQMHEQSWTAAVLARCALLARTTSATVSLPLSQQASVVHPLHDMMVHSE